MLHVDIGGGTTKLALIDNGAMLGVAAFAVGGRLLATDDSGAWTRVDDSARLVAEELGTRDRRRRRSPIRRCVKRIARRLADDRGRLHPRCAARRARQGAAADRAAAAAVRARRHHVLGRRCRNTSSATSSAGIRRYRRLLAAALADELSRRTALPLIDPGQRIRATVIGASQFTVQVSGKTIYLPDPGVLPVHNVPVVHVGLDLAGDSTGALTAAIRHSLTLHGPRRRRRAWRSPSPGTAIRNTSGSRRSAAPSSPRSRRTASAASRCC